MITGLLTYGKYDLTEHLVNQHTEALEMGKSLQMEDMEQVSVSFKLKVTHASLLSVMADDFGKSRHQLGGDLLESLIQDFFCKLEDEERLNIAKRADALSTAWHLDQGHTIDMTGLFRGEVVAQKNEWTEWEYADDRIKKLKEEHGKNEGVKS